MLCVSSRPSALHAQASGSVGRVKRCDGAKGKAAQHLQGDRDLGVVNKISGDRETGIPLVPGHPMLHAVTLAVFKPGKNDAFVPFLQQRLIDETKGIDAGRTAHGMPLGKGTRVGISHHLDLCQRIDHIGRRVLSPRHGIDIGQAAQGPAPLHQLIGQSGRKDFQPDATRDGIPGETDGEIAHGETLRGGSGHGGGGQK
jgi:hypothetical protein